MPLPSSFKSRRLHRTGWSLPFLIGFSPAAATLAWQWGEIFLAVPDEALWYAPEIFFDLAVALHPALLGVCAFLSIVGLMYGIGFSKSASQMLAQGLGVRILPDDAALTRRVHALAGQLGLPPPKVGVMREANAYAIGSSPKDAAVIVGLPLVDALSPAELDAIIGHELGHIASGDMRRMQMAAGFQTMLDSFTGNATRIGTQTARQQRNGAFAALLILIIGLIVQAIVNVLGALFTKRLSRSREYVADAFGALVSSPADMANALKTIYALPATSSATSQRFAYLMFYTAGGGAFATHPTLERRLAALESGRHLKRLIASGRADRLQRAVTATQSAWRQGHTTLTAVVRHAGHRWQTTDMTARVIDVLDRHLVLVVTSGVVIGMLLALSWL